MTMGSTYCHPGSLEKLFSETFSYCAEPQLRGKQLMHWAERQSNTVNAVPSQHIQH